MERETILEDSGADDLEQKRAALAEYYDELRRADEADEFVNISVRGLAGRHGIPKSVFQRFVCLYLSKKCLLFLNLNKYFRFVLFV